MKSRFQSACLTYHPVPKQPFLTPNQAHLLASGQSSTLRVDSAQVLTLNNIFSKVSSEEPDGRRLRKQKCRMPLNFWVQTQQISRDHALRIADLLDSASSASCHAKSSFYVYAVSVAGSILSLVNHILPQPDHALAEGLQKAIQYLDRTSQTWEHAAKMVRCLGLTRAAPPNSSQPL